MTFEDSKEMYKIQYQAGQGKVEVLSILVKEGENWVLLKNPRIEDTLVSKFIKKDHHHRNGKTMGYGQIIVNDKLTYITGIFEVTKEEPK